MNQVANPTDKIQKRETTYEFGVEFFDSIESMQNAEIMTSARLDVNWESAIQFAGFQAYRDEQCERLPNGNELFSVEPHWNQTLGAPYVDRVTFLLVQDRSKSSVEIPIEFFANSVRIAKQKEISQGTLAESDQLIYRIVAFAKQKPEIQKAVNPFSVETVETPWKISFAEEDDFRCRAVPSKPETESSETNSTDFPVYLRREIIDQATAHLKEAGAAEVGGILFGDVYRDPNTRSLFAVVSAQIFARQAKSELTQLSFTAETWADVDAAIKLRGRNEIWLGWWHTHPARQWCAKCPIENRKKCKLSGEFFSSQDEHLHRAVFPQAYSIALVISDSYASGITWPMFGWRNGVIAQREFHILNESPKS